MFRKTDRRPMPLTRPVALATVAAFFLVIDDVIEVIFFSHQVRFNPNWKWLLAPDIRSALSCVLLFIDWPGQTLVLMGVLLDVHLSIVWSVKISHRP